MDWRSEYEKLDDYDPDEIRAFYKDLGAGKVLPLRGDGERGRDNRHVLPYPFNQERITPKMAAEYFEKKTSVICRWCGFLAPCGLARKVKGRWLLESPTFWIILYCGLLFEDTIPKNFNEFRIMLATQIGLGKDPIIKPQPLPTPLSKCPPKPTAEEINKQKADYHMSQFRTASKNGYYQAIDVAKVVVDCTGKETTHCDARGFLTLGLDADMRLVNAVFLARRLHPPGYYGYISGISDEEWDIYYCVWACQNRINKHSPDRPDLCRVPLSVHCPFETEACVGAQTERYKKLQTSIDQWKRQGS